MNLTAEDIIKITRAGNTITVHPDGTFSITSNTGFTARQERNRRYYESRKALKTGSESDDSRRIQTDSDGNKTGSPPPPPSFPPNPLSSAPPPVHTHPPAYTREDPCALEEAQRFALQNGINMSRDGVEYWHSQRSKSGWMVHHNNGTSTPIMDWKKDMRGSTTWVREREAELKTKELRLKREQSYANTASKPKQSTFFP